jgi:hypothetical protein
MNIKLGCEEISWLNEFTVEVKATHMDQNFNPMLHRTTALPFAYLMSM